MPGILQLVTRLDLCLIDQVYRGASECAPWYKLEFFPKLNVAFEPLKIIEFNPSSRIRFETGRIPGTNKTTSSRFSHRNLFNVINNFLKALGGIAASHLFYFGRDIQLVAASNDIVSKVMSENEDNAHRRQVC